MNPALFVSLALCCVPDGDPDRPSPLGYAPDRFAVDAILNGSFELACDSTTKPRKMGAYWKGAFVHERDVSDDWIEEVADGHALRLDADRDPVTQIVTLFGPFAASFTVTLRARFESPAARLVVEFATQGGRRVEHVVDGREPAVGPLDADGFRTITLPVGAEIGRATGGPPSPWGCISLAAAGGNVLVDDVIGRHELPRIRPTELREMLLEDVRDILRIFLAAPDGDPLAGLGLVDASSGYLIGVQHDAKSGEVLTRTSVVGISGIHQLMVNYLHANDDDPDAAPLVELVRDRLRKHVVSLMKQNVYPSSHLYCLYNLKTNAPVPDVELSPTHFIDYVSDVAELLADETITTYAEVICGEMADRLIELREQHDLPKSVPFGRGPGGNWHGRMPEKISALGVLAPPKKSTYDQAWAISQNRSWYHDFDTLVGLMRVWRSNPKPEYRAAVDHVIERFDRQWDAERYDMENDTDDHYGKNVEAALLAYRNSGCAVPALLEFAQAVTDYRLPRDRPWDENLWVEGIRLGSFTTGDQPRAYRGPVWLCTFDPKANPTTSGYDGYRHAIRELCRSDLKRRVLIDGSLTEASSYMWEMISACFQSDYIGPCDEDREWEGDMGDQFAGPSANAFRALGRTLEISRPGEDLEFVAWYALLHAHTLATYREPFGYRFGMAVETGRHYGIPERYLTGMSNTDPYGNACAFIHAETLTSVDLTRDPDAVRIDGVAAVDPATEDGARTARIIVSGPARGAIELRVASRVSLTHVGVADWRLLHADPTSATSIRVDLAEDGRGEARVPIDGDGPLAVDAILRAAEDGPVLDVASGVFSVR